MGIYTGRILKIDLTKGSFSVEKTNMCWAKQYFGGKGLGIRYLMSELPSKTDPLGEDNKMILMPGPLAGTIVSSSSKLAIITKSPATGTILDCSIGGNLAAQVKYAGYDGIIISGKSKSPVYISIFGDTIKINDANHLWGTGAHYTEISLRKQFKKDDVAIAAIGPAGEKLVPFACISSELYRQAGRGGVGAVMGSKNLKAIVINGDKGITVDDMDKLMQRMQGLMKEEVIPDGSWAYNDGTPILVNAVNSAGILPTKNFNEGTFKEHEAINSNSCNAKRIKKKACFGCAIGCGNFVKYGDVTVEGPEYETLALAGSNCGISDLKAITQFNKKCDDLGLDTISTGNVIGLAMDMTEKGIHNFDIRFGDVGKYLQIPELIAERKGIGVELSLGSKKIAEKYGVEGLAMEVKGLEIPGYEPRGSWGMGLAYATSDRGACHMRGFTVGSEALGDLDPFTVEGKAAVTIEKFSIAICDFWGLTYDMMAEILNMVSGSDYDATSLEKAGKRIYTLSRLFNYREGFDRKDDYLPRRVFKEPLRGEGPAAGKLIPKDDFEQMLSEYYNLRGWDKNGMPKKQTLIDLKMDKELIKVIE